MVLCKYIYALEKRCGTRFAMPESCLTVWEDLFA